jgi:hypothetical protein
VRRIIGGLVSVRSGFFVGLDLLVAAGRFQSVHAVGSADPSAPRDVDREEEPLSEADALSHGTLDALRIADAAFTRSPVDHELPGRVNGQLHLDLAVRLTQAAPPVVRRPGAAHDAGFRP